MCSETSNCVVTGYFITSVASYRCNKAMCPLHPAAVIVSAVQRHPWVFLTSDSRLFVLLSVLQKKKKKNGNKEEINEVVNIF